MTYHDEYAVARTKSDTPDRSRPRKFTVIEWPLNASSEWILATFGERADLFVRQLAEISAKRRFKSLLETDVDIGEPEPTL